MEGSEGPMSKRQRTECPTFDGDAALEFLHHVGISPSVFNECGVRGGKRKTKKMRGGMKLTAQQVKYGMYFFLAILAGLGLMAGTARTTVLAGLQMLFSGECGFVSNRVWGALRLENPICSMYNSFVFTAMKAIYDLNKEALATLVGELLLLAATPVALDRTLDFISKGAVGQVATRFPDLVRSSEERAPIEDVQEVETGDARNLLDRINSALAASRNAPEGGKRRRKTRRGVRKTGRKSRKTRSKRRTRRH